MVYCIRILHSMSITCRSLRCNMTIIKRTLGRVFQLVKTVWTICYQGCTENTPQHPLLGNVTAPSIAVVFPYLSANLQALCLFLYFLANKFALPIFSTYIVIISAHYREIVDRQSEEKKVRGLEFFQLLNTVRTEVRSPTPWQSFHK